jgi:hypothetical protein
MLSSGSVGFKFNDQNIVTLLLEVCIDKDPRKI